MKKLGALVLLGGSTPAFGGHEVIDRFRLRACAITTCVAVDADEARRSPLDAAYVFKQARVKIAMKDDDGLAPAREFAVRGGYYDPKFGYLVLHGRPGGLINLQTGRVIGSEGLEKRGPVLARNFGPGNTPRRSIQTGK